MRRHTLFKILLSLIPMVFFLGQGRGLWTLPWVERLEHLVYDLRLQLTLPGGRDPRVVIIDVDEASLRAEGQWPWPRERLARLVERLFDDYHLTLLGFDMVFAEPDSAQGSRLAQRLPVPAGGAPDWLLTFDPDRRFAEALRNRPVVLGYYFNSVASPAGSTGVLPLPAPVLPAPEIPEIPLITAQGFGANLALLAEAAPSAGFFNSQTLDRDGVFRRVPLLTQYHGGLYEQLALAMVRRLFGEDHLDLVIGAGYPGGVGHESGSNQHLEAIRVGGLTLPVDDLGVAWVPYRGPQGSFPYVPAAAVLAGQVDPAVLDGAIGLIGSTAPGLLDLRTTPMQASYPGVEVHANLIAGMLDQRLPYRPAYFEGIEGVQLVLLSAVGLWLVRLSPGAALLVTLAILLFWVAGNFWLWHSHGLVVPVVSALLLTLSLYLLQTSYSLLIQDRRERQITRLFGQYVPPTLVTEMSERPGGSFALEGESREMTVLFADLQDFTTLSEGLSPRQLSRLMHDFLNPMTAVIQTHRGTIDKYIGDAIMAFWGAPLADPEHPRHALQAALGMVAQLQALAPEFAARGLPVLKMRIGINTGLVRVGNMGSDFRMSYTVLGDVVNLASRLESAAKIYGAPILIGRATRDQVPDCLCRELDDLGVKGRAEPVRVFEPLGFEPNLALSEELEQHRQALVPYRQGDWVAALAAFSALATRYPQQSVYTLFLNRISSLQTLPPGHWDGVFRLDAK